MDITWAGRLRTIGATPAEVTAIQAGYNISQTSIQKALDHLVAGIDNAGLFQALTTWRTGSGPFEEGFPGGGLPFGTDVAILTGNPADDAYPISAGTGQKMTSVPAGDLPVSVESASQPFVNGEVIDMLTDFTNVGPGSDNTTELQTAVNQLAAAGGGDIVLAKHGTWGIDGALPLLPGTATVTIASPAVFTLAAHGFSAGQGVIFSTTGALPTGLQTGLVYFVIAAGLTANTFQVSAAYAGSAVTTTGSQSGTHTCAPLTGQIMFPGLPFGHGIRIRGTASPSDWGGENDPGAGVTIQSNATSGAVFAVAAAGSGGQPSVSQLMAHFENLSIKCAAGGSAIDLYNANALEIRRCYLISAATYPGDGSFGLRLPQINAGDWYPVRDLATYGFGNSVSIYECAKFLGAFTPLYSDTAVLCNGGGYNIFDYINALSTSVFTVTHGTELNAYVLIQPGTKQLFNDPTGQLGMGAIRLSPYGAGKLQGARQGPSSVNGGTSFFPSGINVGWAGEPGWRAQHPQDNFARIAFFAPPTAAAYPGCCSETLHPWHVLPGSSSSFSITQQTGFGQLFSTLASGPSTALVPTLGGINGGRSRMIKATFTLGATLPSAAVIGHWVNGGTHSGKYIAAQIWQGTTIFLQIGGTNVLSIGGLISPSTTYTLGLALTMGADGLPNRARILLNGARVADHWFTATERALFTGGTWPFLEDGVQFYSDQVSYCTSFITTDLDDEDIGSSLVTATATRTAMAGETTRCTSGTFTVTLPPPAANAPPNAILNTGSGTITVHPPSGTLANLSGATGDITLAQGAQAKILTDGTNFFQVG